MDTMTSPPDYVLARSVLLEALQVLEPHLDAFVLVEPAAPETPT